MKYVVYVLLSERDGRLYIGYTTDLDGRLKAHSAGKCTATKDRRPLKLIFSEHYLSKGDAKRREKYLKSSAGKRALKIMLRETLADG